MIKAVKYLFGAVSLTLTVSILSLALIKPPEEYPGFKSILFFLGLVGVLVLLGGFFVMIAERKKLFQDKHPLMIWLYVILIPVVSWLDILLQPEPDNSKRIKNLFRDIYKFASYLWGYRLRFICFVVTVAFLIYLPLDSSEKVHDIKFIVSIVYLVFIIKGGMYFFKIAERKQCLIMNNKILTWLYLFFVPVASWKEIFLKPEADGSRVTGMLNDTAVIIRFLARYLLGSIVFVITASIIVFFPIDTGMTLGEILTVEAIILTFLAVIGAPFVYIAHRKKLFSNAIILWLYVIFVPLVSWVDIVLSKSRGIQEEGS